LIDSKRFIERQPRNEMPHKGSCVEHPSLGGVFLGHEIAGRLGRGRGAGLRGSIQAVFPREISPRARTSQKASFF
jgi:hypothetical protein